MCIRLCHCRPFCIAADTSTLRIIITVSSAQRIGQLRKAWRMEVRIKNATPEVSQR